MHGVGRNRVSAERVISGPGLADTFEYLLTLHPELDNHPITAEFHDAAQADKPVVVASHAEEGDVLCAQAVSMLMTAYGAEAGNVALKFIPLGGLYIAGGLAPKNKVRLESLSPVMAWTYKHNLLQQEAILESLERAQLYVHQASVAGVEDEQAGGAWPGFMPAFLDKGRQQDLVSRIPVKLVRRSQSCCKRGGGA